MENVIWAKLEDYNLGRPSQLQELLHPLEVNAQLHKLFWDRGLDVEWVTVVGHMTPYNIRKECYLLRSPLFDARSCSLRLSRYPSPFTGAGRRGGLVMHNADTQCMVQGERTPKGWEDFLFKHLLFYHKNMTFISQILTSSNLWLGYIFWLETHQKANPVFG